MSNKNVMFDMMRNIEWLDANASAGLYDEIPGESSTVASKLESLADTIGYHLAGAGIKPTSVSARDVVAILAGCGMSAYGVEAFGRVLADMAGSDFRNGGMSSQSIVRRVDELPDGILVDWLEGGDQ